MWRTGAAGTHRVRAVVLMGMMQFSSWMVVGSAWICRWAVFIKKNPTGVVYTGKKSGCKIGAPHPFGMFLLGKKEIFLCCGSAVPSPEPPEWDQGKVRKETLSVGTDLRQICMREA